MKRISIFLGVVILIGIALFFVLRNKGSEIKYRTEKIARGDIIEAVTATGTVNAVTTVLVGTQVSGTIKHIYVDFNSPVRKGS